MDIAVRIEAVENVITVKDDASDEEIDEATWDWALDYLTVDWAIVDISVREDAR